MHLRENGSLSLAEMLVAKDAYTAVHSSMKAKKLVHSSLKATSAPFGWTHNAFMMVTIYFGSLLFLCLISALYGYLKKRRASQEADFAQRFTVKTGQLPGDQVGRKLGFFGALLLFLWGLSLVAGQVLIVLLIVSDLDLGAGSDPLGWKNGDDWDSLAWPFVAVYVLSGIQLYVVSWHFAQFRNLFMYPCDLFDADAVFVMSGSQEYWCKVDREEDHLPAINFLCFRYTWDEAHQRYRATGEISEVSAERVAELRESPGLSSEEAAEGRAMHGPNEVAVEVPSVIQALGDEFISPTVVYQHYMVVLQLFTHVWNVGAIYMALILGGGLYKSLWVERRNKVRIAEMARSTATVRVRRDGAFTACPATELVPGDLVLIESNTTVPADCILVAGGVVVDEAMITGEPLPVAKTAPGDGEAPGKGSSIFGGTDVLDAGGLDEGGALAVVKAIGGATLRGSLIRLVLFPSEVHFQYADDLPYVYGLLVLYAVMVSVVLLWAQMHKKTTWIPGEAAPEDLGTSNTSTVGVILLCIFTLSQAINPLLAVALVMGQSAAADRLQDRGVRCLSPSRVPIAGTIDVMVLDKTGTITQPGMQFAGILSPGTEEPVTDLAAVAEEFRFLLASCHKLTRLPDGSLAGNAVELEMLAAVGWQIEAGEKRAVTDGTARLEVLRVLDFDHNRMTSGAVVKMPDGSVVLFVKGATNRVVEACASPPADLVATSDAFSAKAFYVLACAVKPCPDEAAAVDAPRDELEAGLNALGLLLFSNELKPDSAEAIATMKGGTVRPVICTGDHLLSGVAVARNTGILPPATSGDDAAGSAVFRARVDFTGGEPAAVWEDLATEQTRSSAEVTGGDDVFLVVEQAEVAVVKNDPCFPQLLPRIAVFGRMLPAGKVEVIELLQAYGYSVGMCGDGGNDCGAMRAAHAGLALSAGDSSIVAPFSAAEDRSLLRVVDLLREGRSCLINNVACFMFFVSYALSITAFKLLLVVRGNGKLMSEWQYIWFDAVINILVPLSMVHCAPAEDLSPYRPGPSLLSARIFVNYFVTAAMFAVLAVFLISSLERQEFYEPWEPAWFGIPIHKMTLLSDNFDCSLCFLCIASHATTIGLMYSYGGHHRRALIMNWRLVLVYLVLMASLGALLFTESTATNCLMKVNCDSATSLATKIPVVTEISCGGVGGCFVGPQVRHWMDNRGNVSDEVHIRLPDLVALSTLNSSTATRPDPNYRDRLTCMPPPAVLDSQQVPAKYRSPREIHNIFPYEFRSTIAIAVGIYFVAFHVFYHGIVSNSFFDRVEREYEESTRGRLMDDDD